MRFFRDVWTDLVDKRLWPLAILLIVALVAVPVLLAGGSDDRPAPAPKTAAAPAPGVGAPGDPAVSVAGGNHRKLPGDGSGNPFRPQHVPRDSTAESTSGPGPSTGSPSPVSGSESTGAGGGGGGDSAGAPASSGGGGGSAGEGGGAPDGGSDAAPTPKPEGRSLAIEVRLGRAGEGAPRRRVEPLTPLPSRTQPLLIYLGVVDGKAAFLVSSDVIPDGELECKPSPGECARAYMKSGEKAFLEVGGAEENTQYLLEVLSIEK